MKETHSQLEAICTRIKRKIINYIIAQESHEDGGKHLHVFLELDAKMNSTNPRIFDLAAGNQSFHPNA